MTPLHRATRIAEFRVVEELLRHGADPDACTYPGRAPGNLSVLGCLGEADQRRLDPDAVMRCTEVLANRMQEATFAAQNTNGNNVWHLMCNRGNFNMIEWLLRFFDGKFGRRAPFRGKSSGLGA